MERFKPTPIAQCNHAVCLELPAEMTDAEVKKFIEDFKRSAKTHRNVELRQLWARRFDQNLDYPVFYIP